MPRYSSSIVEQFVTEEKILYLEMKDTIFLNQQTLSSDIMKEVKIPTGGQRLVGYLIIL